MSKRLGQHFLVNKPAIQKIIAALDLQPKDTIIEIGPGKGALTLPLVRECSDIGCKIIAIEKDLNLVNLLISELVNWTDVEIIKEDALKLINQLTDQLINYKVVGNIPYYITGKLLRIVGELEQKPELIVLTIQKEVAERIAAVPPKMNLLAAATQIWADPKIIGRLKPKDFNPPPKVDSAIIKLKPRSYNLESSRLKNYYKTIKAVFKQPRKTLLNNLSTPFDVAQDKSLDKLKIKEILAKIGLSGQERPQNLSLSQLVELSLLLG